MQGTQTICSKCIRPTALSCSAEDPVGHLQTAASQQRSAAQQGVLHYTNSVGRTYRKLQKAQKKKFDRQVSKLYTPHAAVTNVRISEPLQPRWKEGASYLFL